MHAKWTHCSRRRMSRRFTSLIDTHHSLLLFAIKFLMTASYCVPHILQVIASTLLVIVNKYVHNVRKWVGQGCSSRSIEEERVKYELWEDDPKNWGWFIEVDYTFTSCPIILIFESHSQALPLLVNTMPHENSHSIVLMNYLLLVYIEIHHDDRTPIF